MAHTLKAYYFPSASALASAVSVNFVSGNSGSSGFALDGYQMGMPGVSAARNSSLTSDRIRPQYSKRETVTDVLSLTVYGASTSDLYTNMHYLVRLGEYARMAQENPSARQVAYLELQPSGGASAVYAPIYDARVEMPDDWLNTDAATKRIEGVTLTIEREIWRGVIPALGAPEFLDYLGTVISGGSVSGSTGSVTSSSVAGDVEAYATFQAYSQAADNIDRMIVGYRSFALGGASHGSLGKKQSESATFGIIADSTSGADGTASGGNAAIITFATSASDTIRFTGASIPHGVHRVFARVRVTAGTTATVKLGYQDSAYSTSVAWKTNTAVTVTSSTYITVDLGIASYWQNPPSIQVDDTVTGSYAVYASRTAGAGSLYVDYLFFMPTEGYVSISGAGVTYANGFRIVYDEASIAYKGASIVTFGVSGVNTEVWLRARSCTFAGELRVKPGVGTFYWIAGADSGGYITDSLSANDPYMLIFATSRFLMPIQV